MSARYKSGSRDHVLHMMAQFAIRDQEAMLDSLIPDSSWMKYNEMPKENQAAIDECQLYISDFKRLMKL